MRAIEDAVVLGVAGEAGVPADAVELDFPAARRGRRLSSTEVRRRGYLFYAKVAYTLSEAVYVSSSLGSRVHVSSTYGQLRYHTLGRRFGKESAQPSDA